MNQRIIEKNNNKNNFLNKKRKYFGKKNIKQVLVKQIDYNSVVTKKSMEEILKEISPLELKEIEESFYNLSGDTNFKLVMGDPNFLSDFYLHIIIGRLILKI